MNACFARLVLERRERMRGRRSLSATGPASAVPSPKPSA